MRTAQQRIDAYNARMVSSQIDPVLTAVNQKAVDNFTAYEMDFYPNQVKLRTYLNNIGVVPIHFGPYEAYHGEIYKLSKTTAGATAIAQAAILVAKYTSLIGPAAEARLKAIADDIYSIVVP